MVNVIEVDSASNNRGHYLDIFLVSAAALLLEISYTRIISFKLFYYYTYLVIGLALLGIGTGGVIVAISKRLRGASTDVILLWGVGLRNMGFVHQYRSTAHYLRGPVYFVCLGWGNYCHPVCSSPRSNQSSVFC